MLRPSRRRPRPVAGRRVRRAPAVTLVAVLAACGPVGDVETDTAPAAVEDAPGDEGGDGVETDAETAPWCDDVPQAEGAWVPEGPGPPTTAEPADDLDVGDLRQEPGEAMAWMSDVEAWGAGEAAESYAGLWMAYDHDTVVVAFADDVDRWATELHSTFHPGFGIAEVANTQAELDAVAESIRADMEVAAGGSEFGEPGTVHGVGSRSRLNRVTVSINEPSSEQLAELSATHGADRLCFEDREEAHERAPLRGGSGG